jgi:hypothetical protein
MDAKDLQSLKIICEYPFMQMLAELVFIESTDRIVSQFWEVNSLQCPNRQKQRLPKSAVFNTCTFLLSIYRSQCGAAGLRGVDVDVDWRGAATLVTTRQN